MLHDIYLLSVSMDIPDCISEICRLNSYYPCSRIDLFNSDLAFTFLPGFLSYFSSCEGVPLDFVKKYIEKSVDLSLNLLPEETWFFEQG